MKLSNTLPAVLLIAVAFTGCSKPDAGQTTDGTTGSDVSTASEANDSTASGSGSAPAFAPVKLGGSGDASGTTGGSGTKGNTAAVDSKPPNVDDVINGLKPIQIVLGKWNGVVMKAAASEVHDWRWDFKTDKTFPSLYLSVPNGNFFTQARITYDPRIDKYKMTTLDAENVTRNYDGEFTADPEDVPQADGKKVDRTFKLQLSETSNPEQNTRYQFVFNQQENNRYLVEVFRARGKSEFGRIDTIGTQRDGTSLARSDEDYGDRTCIISQGLGTSQVSYMGKSYWVCCSGCAAAFNDDPATWIARFEAKKKEAEKK